MKSRRRLRRPLDSSRLTARLFSGNPLCGTAQGFAMAAAVCVAMLSGGAQLRAQEAGAGAEPDAEKLSQKKFEEQSLALRTALHYDPSIGAPLQSLLNLYRKENRLDELLAIYRAHQARYPDDASAQAVLIRLLRELRDPEAGLAVRGAVNEFADDDYIRYLYYQELAATRDETALDELSRALDLAERRDRRRAWLDELIERAIAEDRTDLTRRHFEAFAVEQKGSADALLQLSRKMHEARLHDLEIETLRQAAALAPAPETKVDIELLAAKAEAALGKNAEAGARLDALLTKVAPDYWRRSQIVIERVHLLDTDAARGQMLERARENFAKNPASEAAVLDLAELLTASELRRDALEALLEASSRLPDSEPIEKKILDLLDRLGDEHAARAYLAKRIEASPGRLDLRYRLVKALYLVADPKEAAKELDRLLAQLGDEDQFVQQLDLARFLRRMNQPADSVPLYERIVEKHPERVDVIRELGEAYLAVGQKDSARRLFARVLPEEVEIENFLDVVQFLVQQEMFLEAQSFLEGRLKQDDANFDLRLLLVEVYAKTGERINGEVMVLATRAIADSLARYNRWLEIAVEFYEIFDEGQAFFDAEQERLSVAAGAVGWTPDGISRFLAYCEVAGRHKQQEQLAIILQDRLAEENLPKELRQQLRRLLVDAMEGNPVNAALVGEQLAILMKEDDGRADEYRLRQAQLHHGANRPDLAVRLLSETDISGVHNPALLSSVYQMFVDYEMMGEARLVLERLTEIDPGTLAHWEKLLALQASMGSEEDLRRAIRRLLAGLDKATLSQESLDSLQLHLLDSYWRSIARVLAGGNLAAGFGEIFSHLDAIERQVRQPGQDLLWVRWTRAYLLNRLGQERARDEAILALQATAARAPADPAAAAGKDRGDEAEAIIAFPDGLSVSLDHAIELLREPPADRLALPVAHPEGPGQSLEVDWVFDADPNSVIVQVEPFGGQGLLVLDGQGTLYRIDVTTGKLVWRKKRDEVFGEGYRPPNIVAAGGSSSLSRYRYPPSFGSGGSYQQGATAVMEPSRLRVAPRFVVDGEDRILIAAGRSVRCLSMQTGDLQWVSVVGDAPPPFRADEAGSVPPEVSLFIEGGTLYTFDPRSSVACGVESATGKLIWHSRLNEGAVDPSRQGITFALNSGASCSAGNLLVFGERAGVIHGASGATTWTFAPGNVRSFPISLRAGESLEQAKDGAAAPQPAGYAGTSASLYTQSQAQGPAAWIDHLSSAQSRQQRISNFLKYRGALVAPALNWIQEQSLKGQSSRAVLHGRQMLLMGKQSVLLLSLELPLAAQSFPVAGSFVGIAGQKACFVRGNGVTIVNLARGETGTCVIWEISGDSEIDAVLSGSRLYITAREGIFCLNVQTGKPLFSVPWPAGIGIEQPLRRDAADPDIPALGRTIEYFWAGVAGGDNGKEGYCIPLRNRVAGDRLFSVIAPGRLVALKSSNP